MARIYPKLDYGKLTDSSLVKRFVDAGFDGIELYTSATGPNSYNDFKADTPIYGRDDIAIKSIHAPIWFPLEGKNEKFNLVYEDKVAEKSLEVLAHVARFSKRHGCDEITIHSWFINPPYEITKKEAHVNMAKNLAKIRNDLEAITILAEVSPMVLWGFPDIFDKQTVMVTTQDYQELFAEGDKHGLNLGWDADIDHMFRTAIYKKLFGSDINVMADYFGYAGNLFIKEDVDQLIEGTSRDFLKSYKESQHRLEYSFIENMLTSLHDRIGHVSVTGADFILDHPRLGYSEGISFEHIPVGFEGEITVRNYSQGFKATDKTAYVRDRLDHSAYLPLVKDKPIVLEFMSRDSSMGQQRKDYDFFEQCVKQKKYLESILSEH